MTRLKEIKDYLLSLKYSSDEIKGIEESTISLASAIMLYAHRRQKRIDGELYYHHPERVYLSLRKFIGADDEGKNIDVEYLEEYCFPFKGTQEVALLHDVIEDTDFSMEEIEQLFEELHFGDYFRKFIKEPLSLITHNKDDSYDQYMDKVLTNKVSSLIKMLDLHDNSNFLSLVEFGDTELNRCKKYIEYAKKINDKYFFIENTHSYRVLFRKKVKED